MRLEDKRQRELQTIERKQVSERVKNEAKNKELCCYKTSDSEV